MYRQVMFQKPADRQLWERYRKVAGQFSVDKEHFTENKVFRHENNIRIDNFADLFADSLR